LMFKVFPYESISDSLKLNKTQCSACDLLVMRVLCVILAI
jgi:hypothetical protein